jgi:hypothetical protein
MVLDADVDAVLRAIDSQTAGTQTRSVLPA